ncbi:MAG: ATP-binding protein [Bacillota bacterium]|nr:ATP-binding protein [Bacillota bacterium]
MIKKLQRRFIFITMTCVGSIFALVLLVLNISVSYSARRQGYDTLMRYEQRMFARRELFTDDNAPLPGEKAIPFYDNDNKDRPDMNWFNDMRVSYVFYNNQGEITELSAGGNPDMTEDTLSAMAEKVLKRSKETGSQSGYLFLLHQSDDITRIYFLDYTPEKDMSMRLFRICLWVGLAGIFVILIPVIFLSRWVTRPVQLAFDKQKQFIADASHELKTPLTIITANAEVLEGTVPGNKWLAHILDQTARMKTLINSLLELAKLDDCSKSNNYLSFNLSKLVQNTALSFESLAYEYDKGFFMEIEDNISFLGNEANIRQLITILLDNAFKYSDKKDTVLIRLSSHGDKKELLVHNTGKGISKDDQKHIFERFYRVDTSRSRKTGGYGLGLSIAQSIVKAHKGHISVKSDGQTYTTFTVIFP